VRAHCNTAAVFWQIAQLGFMKRLVVSPAYTGYDQSYDRVATEHRFSHLTDSTSSREDAATAVWSPAKNVAKNVTEDGNGRPRPREFYPS
jgi:hypothetical protein